MENEHLLDINTDNLPMTSSPKDQSPASFSRDLIGRLGISSQGTETVIPETQSEEWKLSTTSGTSTACSYWPSSHPTYYSYYPPLKAMLITNYIKLTV